ncbi:hypothetical protein N7530_003049 [Penicillium desertorum]|uniref:PAC1-like LisH-like dimerisation domain-containing protein n=1 Tax=Penicillium desertorum TaxID=1303715 RepID=A0A9X0BTM6_9EURO|nr:hypothetical protein N7530_003049 [Penicillium desertorum]
MPSSLTPQQAGELNKSLIAYLSANGHAETLAAFRKESDFPDDRFDATAAKHYWPSNPATKPSKTSSTRPALLFSTVTQTSTIGFLNIRYARWSRIVIP